LRFEILHESLETGFFYDNTWLRPANSVKNPVSLIDDNTWLRPANSVKNPVSLIGVHPGL